MNRYFGLHTLEGEWHALLPRYLFLAERVEGARILDIGCGSGLGSSLLLELGAHAVDAIDHRPAVLELARMKHAKQGLDFHVMFWEELDFPDESFDIILCLDPSSPVTDPNLLSEVRRVVKPDGEYICAIERKTVQGFESLLPRYGYTDTAEHVDLNQASGTRVPQLGELSRHFEHLHTLSQRPHYSFFFESVSSDEDALDGEEHGEQGDEPADPREDGPAPKVDIDKAFCTNESEIAGVELWMCSDAGLPLPTLKEVRLPYYSLTERLKMMIHDLHTRQRPPKRNEELFDELLDEASEVVLDEERQTGEHNAFEEDIPTQVRARPVESGERSAKERSVRPTLQLEQLDAHLSELDALHRRIKTDFERLFFETRASFDERDERLHAAISRMEARLTPQAAQEPEEVGFLRERVAQLEAEIAHLRANAPMEGEPTTEFAPEELPEAEAVSRKEAHEDLDDIIDEAVEAAADAAVEAAVDAAAAEETTHEEIDPAPSSDAPDKQEGRRRR